MFGFIIFRDRTAYARQCMSSLMAAGLEPVIADFGSTYPPAEKWLAHLRKSGVRVYDVGPGHHPRQLWEFAWMRQLCAQERYVVTDPDVIPSEDCPRDWPAYLEDILERYPGYPKVGLSLRIDRIPQHYARRENVINWESQFYRTQIGEGVYHADVDTTLAMHNPIQQMGCHTFRSLRTQAPYVADHVAWYEDFDNLTEEQRYYHEHAEPDITFWTLPGKGAGDNLNDPRFTTPNG